MFRLVVFDLDGTLVDSRRDIAEAVNALLAELGARAPLPETTIGRMVGDGAGQLVSRAFEAAGLVEPVDALERFLTLYDSHLIVHTRPYEGMIDVLSALRVRSMLAVLTNKPLDATHRMLDGLGLASFFAADAIVGGDGPLPRKPDPAGLQHLIAQASVLPESAVLVGDSVVDWRTARHAGTAICLARYGFGFHSFPTDQLSGREILVDAPRDLLRWL